MREEMPLTAEPRWPSLLALLSIAGLHLALPPQLRIGPDWLVLLLVGGLSIPAIVFHGRGNWRLAHALGHAATVVVTVSVSISLTLLLARLPGHRDPPE